MFSNLNLYWFSICKKLTLIIMYTLWKYYQVLSTKEGEGGVQGEFSSPFHSHLQLHLSHTF